MGGRGASSGISVSGKRYGTEYKTVLQEGNIKFIVQRADGSQVSPMETMTKGRVYVLIDKNKNELKSITYFDSQNKRSKQIDLNHAHKGMQPHTHHGYLHNEYGASKKGASKLSTKEQKMVEKVYKKWYNYVKRKE
ncbi:hypothetical protein NHG29_04150 [Aerococcaceae bacterium NML160702]|nr:hypothetical protein [Aerococcaceae bacterium NML160702]